MPDNNSSIRTAIAVAVMLVTPLFFSTNLIFGRGVVGEVAPFTLAFLRWLLVALCLSPILFHSRLKINEVLRSQVRMVFLLGFLGMWICGAIVYLALTMTTATNGTLIYTTSPVIIICIEAVFFDRPIRWREATGSFIAFAGIVVIVLKGDWQTLTSLTFNPGDLLFILAAISWAIYSVILRSSQIQEIGNAASLGLIAAAGALCLLPFSLAEYFDGAAIPTTSAAWQNILGIVVFASLIAFAGFQYGISVLGPSVASIFMYLLPPYGVTLAVLVLGEAFHTYHAIGIIMVMTGIILATFPFNWLKERLGSARRAG